MVLNFDSCVGSHGERGSEGKWVGGALYLLLMTASVGVGVRRCNKIGTNLTHRREGTGEGRLDAWDRTSWAATAAVGGGVSVDAAMRALTMLTALMLLRLLVMMALLVLREQAVVTTLVVSLLLLVQGYSMSHCYTSHHGKAKPRMESRLGHRHKRGRECWMDLKESDQASRVPAGRGTCQDTMRNHPTP